MAALAKARNAHAGAQADRGFWFSLRINVFAIGLAALWIPLNVIVLPDRVDATAPGFLRGSALGLITVMGIGIATILQPVAGRWSDEAPGPDRRRPFIVIPAAIMLAVLVLFGWAPSFLFLLIAYVLLQVASNVGQAALQGLIPDFVPRELRGVASGVKTGLDVAGIALGLAAAGLLLSADAGHTGVLLFMGAVLAISAALTWLWVPPEAPAAGTESAPPAGPASSRNMRSRLSARLLVQAFAEIKKAPEQFRLAVLMRLLFMLGMYVLQRFLLFFMEDRFGLQNPERSAAVFIVAGFVIAGIAAGAAGALSDAFGRPLLLRLSVLLGTAGLLGVAMAPTLPLLAAVGVAITLAAGAFQAVNWALLSESIPEGRGAQYFGLANIAKAGAGALAGLLGPVLDVAHGLPVDPYAVTFALAAAIVLASLLPLRRLKEQAEAQPEQAASGAA